MRFKLGVLIGCLLLVQNLRAEDGKTVAAPLHAVTMTAVATPVEVPQLGIPQVPVSLVDQPRAVKLEINGAALSATNDSPKNTPRGGAARGIPTGSNACPAANVGVVTNGSTIVGSTTGSTDNFVASCGSNAGGRDEIFEFTVDVPGVWGLDSCSVPACWDTTLEIREETGGGCPGDFVACDGDGCNVCYYESAVSAILVPASTYYLIVDGWNSAAYGDFVITATLITPGCTVDADCDDGIFCNGAETCDLGTGQCLAGTNPCLTCDEVLDECVFCEFDSDCDDGVFCNGAETCVVETGQCADGPTCSTYEGYTAPCDEAGASCPKPVNTAIWLANAEGLYFSPGACDFDGGTATWVLDDIQGSHHTTGVLETYTTPILARSTPDGASPLGTVFLVNQSLFTVEPGSCNPAARIDDSGCTSPATVDPGGSPAHDLLCGPVGPAVVLPNNAGDFSRCEVDFFIAFRTTELGAGMVIAGGTAELGGPAAADDFGVNVVWFEDCPPTGSYAPAAFGCPGCVSDFDAAEVHAVPGGACCHPDGSCSLTPEADCDGTFGATGTINGTDGGCGGDQDGDGLDSRCGDNCPDDANPGQEDCDGNGVGDVCEANQADGDADGVLDVCDNCPLHPNPDQADCNDDNTGDVCAIAQGTSQDCNSNGIPDSCDLAAGTSEDLFGPGGVGGPDGVPDDCQIDCDGDGTPDLEEADFRKQDCDRDGICNGVQIDNCPPEQPSCGECNGNDIPDGCDIADGTSEDCNGNGIPDECDIAGGTSDDCNGDTIPDECQPDCNKNGVADDCDLVSGTSLDCNNDGIPDECQPDCNNNGILDVCDLDVGRSLDCNGNAHPDECDIAHGTSEDCTGNGIPDECEADCNGNGAADSCDILDGTSADCNDNGIPDECELSAGTVEDCNGNGVPDECDLAAGTSVDINGNGVPDECEAQACCFVSLGFSVCQDLIPSGCEPLENGVSQGLDTACPTENIFTAGHGSGPFTHLTDPAAQCPEGGGRGADCIDGDPIDPWSTAIDAVMCHLFGVPDSPPLPADFFGPGSDPFTGQVCLEGKPLGPTPFGDFGEADTLVRRTGGPAGTGDPFDRCELPSANQVIVNAEVVALNLESTAPITVTFNGGQNPELWDVAVDRSQVTPPPGSITAVKTHCNGGTYNSELHVQPRFTFTKVAAPNNSEVLDTGLAGIPFIALIQDTDPSWTGDVADTLGLASPICTDFHPAIEDTSQTTACDCNGNGARDLCDIEDGASEDCNENGIPDSCELDSDADGVIDDCDNCPSVANPDQADADGDGAGDLCDPCPNDPEDDADGDGVCVPEDNCPDRANPAQADGDGDGLGDVCDSCPLDNPGDTDGDGACDSGDNCPSVANPDQADADGDLIGDLCDACPLDSENDADGDGVCLPEDNCPDVPNPDQANTDGDSLGDACDPCPNDPSVACECESAADCSDGFFCNGQETCEQGTCSPGANPCPPLRLCFEVTDQCEAVALLPAGPPHDIRKNRYISIDPRGVNGANAGLNFDIKLTLTSSLVNGVTAVGSSWWANAPDANCISVVGQSPPVTALNWDDCSTLHLTGCPIIPTSSFDIVAVVGVDDTEPLIAETQAKPGVKWHGDCVGSFDGVIWTAPNLNVNIDDAVAAIKTFQNINAFNATHVSVTDVVPNLNGMQINKVVNINDVFSIILGFQGQEYPGPDLSQCP